MSSDYIGINVSGTMSELLGNNQTFLPLETMGGQWEEFVAKISACHNRVFAVTVLVVSRTQCSTREHKCININLGFYSMPHIPKKKGHFLKFLLES